MKVVPVRKLCRSVPVAVIETLARILIVATNFPTVCIVKAETLMLHNAWYHRLSTGTRISMTREEIPISSNAQIDDSLEVGGTMSTKYVGDAK